MELPEGIEPTTYRLQGDCTTYCAMEAYKVGAGSLTVPHYIFLTRG